MAGEITYSEYRIEDFAENIFRFAGGGSSNGNGNYLLKTGDSATGNYSFDTNTFIIDSVNHKIGIRTTEPVRSLDINATDGNCLRLIYNDDDSNPTIYTDFSVDSDGHLNVNPIGNLMDLLDNNFVTTGGLGIGDSNVTAGIVNVGIGFRIANVAASGAILRGNGTNFVSNAVAALTKTDDTNVTLTLGGTPTEALVTATSLTLGWSGQLAVGRGGTGLATATAYAVLCGGTTGTGAFQSIASVGTAGYVLTSNGAGALPTFQVAGGAYWAANGNDIYNTNSGNVGVGHLPIGKFDVWSADANATTGDFSIIAPITYPLVKIGRISSTSNSSVQFLVRNREDTACFVVDTNNSVAYFDYNNVGIGKIPVYVLDIAKNLGAAGDVVLSLANTYALAGSFDESLRIRFQHGLFFAGEIKSIREGNYTDMANSDAGLYLSSAKNGDAGGYIYINSDGNVGINKINPGTALDANGVITATGGTSTNWNDAYTHSQIAGGNSVHVSVTENTNWDTAYTHSQSSSQAHSDYLINNGNDSTSGTLTATNFILSSDKRIKKNIKLFNSDKFLDIQYKQFELKNEPKQLRYGVIAQELQSICPELIRIDNNGIMSVAYIDLIIREIVYLKNKVKELERG
jgi:hypothetical protein